MPHLVFCPSTFTIYSTSDFSLRCAIFLPYTYLQLRELVRGQLKEHPLEGSLRDQKEKVSLNWQLAASLLWDVVQWVFAFKSLFSVWISSSPRVTLPSATFLDFFLSCSSPHSISPFLIFQNPMADIRISWLMGFIWSGEILAGWWGALAFFYFENQGLRGCNQELLFPLYSSLWLPRLFVSASNFRCRWNQIRHEAWYLPREVSVSVVWDSCSFSPKGLNISVNSLPL